MTEASTDTRRNRFSALRLLLPYFRPYRLLMAGWLGFLLLSSLATLSLPVAVRLMIDHGFARADPSRLNASFAGLFAVAVVMAIATAARYFCISVLGERVVADLRRRLYAHLLTLDQAFYERTRVGELISRLGADTELVQTVVSSSISVALRGIVTALGGAIMLVATSPRLAGYAGLVIPLVILPIVLAGRRQQKLARANQDRVADASAVANETLNAMYAVQAYAREPVETARYDAAIVRAVASARRRIAQRAGLTALVILLIFGAITLVLWSGAHSVMTGELGAGVLSQFVLYAVLSAGSIGGLTEVWSEISRASGAMERIGELMATQPEIRSPLQTVVLPEPLRRDPLRARRIPLPLASRCSGAARFQPQHLSGRDDRPGRAVGRREKYGFPLVAALLRSAARHDPHRRRRSESDRAADPARRNRAGASGHRDLRCQRARQYPLRSRRRR
jgi:ATP-binding cassette subfamily B protein